MGRPLDTYDHIAIASLVIYTFFIAGGVYLCIKHGFKRSSGWRFLIILALARIIGDALRLATVSDPTNVSLYIGWMTLNGLGLGPLILVLLGLLDRVFDSINRQGHVVVKPMYQRLLGVLMLVGIVLLIVGGTQSDYHVGAGGQPKIEYSAISKAGTGIFAAATALLCLETFLAFSNQGYVSQGEHRIILCVIASLPFVIARLAYSCLLVFGGVTSTVWLYLGLLVIMEMVVVLLCEVLGFTLDKAPPMPPKDDQEMQLHQRQPRQSLHYSNH
ncbi:transmembrane protein [Purpureocillium lavendulum]|uniref:Transmembrane protein n=1 Tax=Purpureocillium lavendulum TaxID=1247861 RepID=A0AB34G053_9HYPO|nr:transmembrane protein [Purpureocillium lavendulum]